MISVTNVKVYTSDFRSLVQPQRTTTSPVSGWSYVLCSPLMRLQQRAPKCNVLCSPLMRLQLRYTTVHRPDAVLESFLSPFILRFPYSARLSSYLGFVQNRDGGWGKKEEKARTQNTQKSDFN